MGAAGGFLLVASLMIAGVPASAAPGDEHLAGLEYVALGDSYAAGYGILPSTGVPVAGCDQSTTNYPHLTATELGLALTDVTCSGAETANLTTTAQVTYSGTAPIQLTALSATTDIVTVTVGGNDLGFVDILTNCAAFTATGPVVAGTADCSTYYNPGGVDTLAAAIAGPVTTAIEATLAAIAVAAPAAKVFVVGYPSLSPATLPSAGCFRTALGSPFPLNAYPYLDVDIAYLHSVEAKLDQAMADAATGNGAVYVSNLVGTDAHSPCATTDAYVNGITVTALTGPPLSVELAPGAMHPNAIGAAYLATGLETAIRAAFPAPPTPPTSPAGGLADTGAAGAGWLALAGVLLILAGGAALHLRRVVALRS